MHTKMQLSKQQKQVIILTGSTILGTLLGIINSVLNTRSLSPEMFGDVRYVQNIIAFVSSLLLVGYFTSGSRLLALSKDEQNCRRIRGIMCVILAITITIVMLTMVLIYVYIGFKEPNSSTLVLFLVAIPFCGCNLMLNYVNTTAQGDNHIERIAIARLIPGFLYFIIAYFIYKYYGATSARMLLLFNGTSFLLLMVVIITTKPSFMNLKESFVILQAENKKYGFNVYLGALAGVSTSYVAGITLGIFCEDNTNVGFYTLAQNMVAPLAMLPSIIGTTYFKRFATEDRISKKLLYESTTLTAGSCLLFILLIKYVVTFLYNESYNCVATYSSWLVVGTCMYGLGDMFNRFLGAHGLGKQIRNAAFAGGGVLLVGSIALVYFFQIYGAIATKLMSSLVYLTTMVYYYIRFVEQKKKEKEAYDKTVR